MESTGKHIQYMIGGVPVLFPCKPYPSQIAMMAKIMRALEKKQNALLESPTGSGKSLALLCSCLAWQKQIQEKLMVEKQKSFIEYQSVAAFHQEASKLCQCHCHRGGVDRTCGTLSAAQTGNRTPVLKNKGGIDSLPYPSVEASTGQLEIKSVTPDQGEVKGLVTNQTYVNTLDQGTVPMFDQKDVKVVVPDQGVVKDPASDQKEIKGQICCDNINSCDGRNNINTPSPAVKSENQVEIIDLSKDDDDDDFKPPKKKYRVVGRRRRGVIYDDDDGDDVKEEKATGGGDGSVNDNQSAGSITQQQQNDSTGHPVWKMQLVGATPPRKQVDVSESAVSMVTTPNNDNGCHGAEVKAEAICSLCPCGVLKAKQEQLAQAVAKKIPVIFFGTRTHKQIKQITHELKKTAYAKTPMSILASREHTCVHPTVSLEKNKNEECHKLIDGLQGEQCSYFHNVGRFATQANIVSCGLDTAWDIEDLVMLGKKKRVCPYFVTRGLKEEAQIVFCPYNYLLDPMVTNQMDLHLEGNVVILDEGHNVEDTARDSSSLSVTMIQLEEVVEEMERMLSSRTTGYDVSESYRTVQLVCNKYIKWMKENEHYLPQLMYEQACKVWHGGDMIEEMRKSMDITPLVFEAYKAHLNSIVAAAREPLFAKSRQDRARYRAGLVATVNMATLAIVENLFIVLGFLLNPRFTNDYRVALMKTAVFKYEQEVDGWNRRQRRRGHLQKVWTTSVNFWCLNPAVAFTGFSNTRCVILTSGTLSPMLSFASELGTEFPIQLEANHVIHNSQVWIGTLSSGPHGRQLCASYQNTESYDFQDEVGHLILSICKTVPYGVLCFFTSYKMLEKLTNRWKNVGIWEQINQQKVVVSEPRAGDKADFERAMMTFYEAVNRANHNNAIDNSSDGCGVDGALFLAVCRGKVSEGLDFIDNNARAVITIGIPYPYVKDKQVELKKEYNNEHCIKKSLLNGGEWYEIQAYRALNQALGRCIRHKNDWGALILVDERFSKSERYTRGLSRWVRQGIKHYSDFASAQISLKRFAEDRLRTTSVNVTTSPPNFMSTCSISTTTPNTSSLRSPPSTPVCPSAVASIPTVTSSPIHTIISPLPSAISPLLPAISPLPPPLSPQTHQLVSCNPQLAGFIAEQLKKTCLQMINNRGDQSPVASASHDPPTIAVAQETAATGVTEVKGDSLIIPDSPPDNTETSSFCESPPLFSSPVKQPWTSTQISNGDVEMKKLDSLSDGHSAEAVHITETVKQEQCNTVVSLSSQGIVLPENPASCDQTDSAVNSSAIEGFPEQRHSLRKRNPTLKMSANIRHTKKRQHSVQPEMGARNRTMCCVECHGELACINAKSDKELASVDLSTRLQNLTKNECKSLLIEWMNSGGAQKVFMIPTSQLVTTSCMTSQIQGSFNSIWDNATGLAYCPMTCSCNNSKTILVQVVAANKQKTLSAFGNKTIVLPSAVEIT